MALTEKELSEKSLNKFADWMQKNQFKIMKKHPNHVPGEAYSAPPFQEWSYTEVIEMYQNNAKNTK